MTIANFIGICGFSLALLTLWADTLGAATEADYPSLHGYGTRFRDEIAAENENSLVIAQLCNTGSRSVVSDVPTRIFAGQFDPITPPEWGQLAAETLSNSFFYEFPNLGHGVLDSNRCALEIALKFLDDPTTEPDVSCMNRLTGPNFE